MDEEEGGKKLWKSISNKYLKEKKKKKRTKPLG